MFNEGDLVELIPVIQFNYPGGSKSEQAMAITVHGTKPFLVVKPGKHPEDLVYVRNIGSVTSIGLFAYRFRLLASPITSLDELM